MVHCPISDTDIEAIDCIVINDIVNDMISEELIDPKLIDNPNYVEICKKCQRESGCIVSK